MSQTIEVDTREAQIAGVVQLFEDRLTSPKPEAGSWAELSRMLSAAPPWRAELNRRWAGREDWQRFLQWEISYQAEQWNRDSLPARRFPVPIKPRVTQACQARHPAGYDIQVRRVSTRKVQVCAIADDGRAYSDTLNDSRPDEDLRDLAAQYAAAPSEVELLAMLQPVEDEPEERILVEFTPGVRGWFEPVEILSDEYCDIEWNQPGAGQVRGCVTRLDVQTEAGEFIWQWDGMFEPIEEEQQAATGQEAEVFAGFVVSESGAYFVQLPQDNEFGFSLFDADQSWPGGIGAARTWTAVARESVPPEVEESMGWIVDGD